MSVPRVAFFTDSFHEVNGVALTSRQFAEFAFSPHSVAEAIRGVYTSVLARDT